MVWNAEKRREECWHCESPAHATGDCPANAPEFRQPAPAEDRFAALRPLPELGDEFPAAPKPPPPAEAHFIPQGDAERKAAPMFRGLLGYFPAALFEVAAHSLESDRKHNPGNPTAPNWARGKSTDQEDCLVRHLIDAGARGTPNRRYHLRALAWRALAILQEDCEADGALPGVSSK